MFVFAQQGASQVEPLGFLGIVGAGHMTYKYSCLCHKSRTLSSPSVLLLLSIRGHPLKLEVIFCVQAVITAPCGVPTFVSDHCPSSDTPAFSHFWISRSTLRSATRSSTNSTSFSWLMLSKKPRMAASSIQFPFFVPTPPVSASSASCAPRPGRKPYENPRKSSS